jgi:hypothetical protein
MPPSDENARCVRAKANKQRDDPRMAACNAPYKSAKQDEKLDEQIVEHHLSTDGCAMVSRCHLTAIVSKRPTTA